MGHTVPAGSLQERLAALVVACVPFAVAVWIWNTYDLSAFGGYYESEGYLEDRRWLDKQLVNAIWWFMDLLWSRPTALMLMLVGVVMLWFTIRPSPHDSA